MLLSIDSLTELAEKSLEVAQKLREETPTQQPALNDRVAFPVGLYPANSLNKADNDSAHNQHRTGRRHQERNSTDDRSNGKKLFLVRLDLGKLCRTFSLGLSMHSNSHLGVSLMAMAHAAAATPHLAYACDTHYPWQSEKDEVVAGGRVPIIDGCVLIPDKPGLGVELDHDQLARGRERYKNCPYRKRDDAAEMRKHVDPNWQRVLPRW